MKLNSKSINYNVQTVDELVSLDGLEGDTVVVTDENRGGVFVYREDNVGTNNEGTIFNGWTRQYSGAVNVKWFGAKGDGVTDDTASVNNCHIFANNAALAVSYSGIVNIAIQANAQIPIKTSVDFCYCEIVILNGVNTTPSFSTFNTMFVVSDNATPLTTVTGAVSATNLAKGSVFPTLGLFDTHGYALLECELQVPNRYEDGTVNYTQSFKVNREGRVSYPLSTDLSAFAANITVKYRKTSYTPLSISNVVFKETGWNNQKLFTVSRCNVSISNISLIGDVADYNNIDSLLYIDNASDIYIDNIVTTGRPVTGTDGSYVLNINGGADIYVNRLNAITGWGATGSNNVNGIRYTNCVLNRIDAHASGHNMFADNCTLHETGMVYGWGGGLLSVKNCVLVRGAYAISSRSDYSGQFFGDFVVDSCEINSNYTSTLYVVNLLSNPIGSSSAIYAPNSISVTNIKRIGKASGNNAEIIPVAIVVKPLSVVYAPTSITIDNITSHVSWRFGTRIDMLSFEKNPSSPYLAVSISNAKPDVSATSTTGIIDTAQVTVPSAYVNPRIYINNCNGVHIKCSITTGASIDVSNSNVNGIWVDTAGATQPIVTVKNCQLLTFASGYTNPPIGGGATGNTSHTSLIGCSISSAAWDLSLISAAIGNTFNNGTTLPLLPATVTVDMLFTGWRNTGVFK